MEWFRWYGGTFGDPKLQWVARQASCKVAEALAVWVAVLERAHQHEQRGCCEGLDFESMDVALGLDDGGCSDIYQAMIRKGMVIDGDMVASWDKRQPKAEDVTATDRKRTQRDKEKMQKENDQLREQLAVLQSQNVENVTECHATSHDVTTEESRLEEKRETLKPQQQQHADASKQIFAEIEERLPKLRELFPSADIPLVVEKLLQHCRGKPVVADAWLLVLKWFQREFKPAPVIACRASPEPAKSKGVLREEAAIQAARETMDLLEEMQNGAKQTGVDVAAGNDSCSRDRTAISQTSGVVSEAFS